MGDHKRAKASERKERLAAELRENLRKRKAQARARRSAEDADLQAGEPPAGLAPPKPVG